MFLLVSMADATVLHLWHVIIIFAVVYLSLQMAFHAFGVYIVFPCSDGVSAHGLAVPSGAGAT